MVRTPASHAGSPWFESTAAHHGSLRYYPSDYSIKSVSFRIEDLERTFDLLDLSPERIASFLVSIGENPVFTGKIIRYLFEYRNSSISESTELPESLKQKLRLFFRKPTLSVLNELKTADGSNKKILFGLEDGNTIESSVMEFKGGNERIRRTVCISSQVGCAVGCPYCATGLTGFQRNLNPGEMIEQALYFSRGPGGNAETGLTNIVFMGMGEPLLNYDNVITAVSMFNSQYGMGFGTRQITISTAGIVPGIQRLAKENLFFQLAVSIQATNDRLRNRLVPVNRTYPLKQLIEACREYSGLTGRKVFFEYVLFDGINDGSQDAEELAALMEGQYCSINLILGNNSGIHAFKPTPHDNAVRFQQQLISKGFRAMLRVSRGSEIDAGCGQLRNRRLVQT